MGARGPKRTPTEILKKRGSRLVGSRRGEPTADPTIPKKPEWVKKKAAFYWKNAVKVLSAMGVLATADAVALGMYCVYLDRWIQETDKDKCDWHLADEKFYAKEVHGGEKSFGLSPADRAGIVVGTPPADDKLDKYFKKPKIAQG